MRLELRCTISGVSRTDPERVLVYSMKGEGGEEVSIELPERIVEGLPGGMMAEGRRLLLVVSSEELDPSEWELLMRGYVYLKRRGEGGWRTLISIGGLILRLQTPYEVGFGLMERVCVGARPAE
ncbi:MAG: hypothetical protein DRJ56_08145 [Thermoprotei archaeon]|nr:MAG: hypothetical protein DRJ56_08145 [Thermoprotei archaeon]